MAVAFTVEDGTGILLANSYLSEKAFTDYWDRTNPDWDYSGFSDDEIMGALVRATRYLDGRYRGQWPGRTVSGRQQALAWPRTGLIRPSNFPFSFLTSPFAQDRDGNDIDDASVPQEVQSACAELAQRETVTPGYLSPDRVSQRVLSISIPGAVSETFERMGDQRPVIDLVDEILAALIVGDENTVILMRG